MSKARSSRKTAEMADANRVPKNASSSSADGRDSVDEMGLTKPEQIILKDMASSLDKWQHHANQLIEELTKSRNHYKTKFEFQLKLNEELKAPLTGVISGQKKKMDEMDKELNEQRIQLETIKEKYENLQKEHIDLLAKFPTPKPLKRKQYIFDDSESESDSGKRGSSQTRRSGPFVQIKRLNFRE